MKIRLIDFGGRKPERKHYNDAGADVRANEGIVIMPHETRKIPLGFGLEVPDGYMALLLPRSGMASRGITCETPPIDSGYRGEICALISNLGDEPWSIAKGDRIAQVVIIPMIIADFVDETGKERGAGGFGSTGTK